MATTTQHSPLPMHVAERIGAASIILALMAYGFIIWNISFGPWNASQLRAQTIADNKWHMNTAVVVAAEPVVADGGELENRPVTLRYTDYYGHLRTATRAMPWQDVVGTREPVLVGANGKAMFVNDQLNTFSDPRYFGTAGIIWSGIIVGLVACFFGAIGLMVAMGLLYLLWRRVRRGRRSVLVLALRLVARPIREQVRTCSDKVRRHRRIRTRRQAGQPASSYYRLLVALQQELDRMDPIPKVLAARARVVEVMSRVLERDTTGRLEEIAGLLEGLDRDVREHLTARALAVAELDAPR